MRKAWRLFHEGYEQGGCGGVALLMLTDPTEDLRLTVANTRTTDGREYKEGRPFVCCNCGEVLGQRFLRIRNFQEVERGQGNNQKEGQASLQHGKGCL